MTTTATMCVNDGGLINPDAFPVRGGDLDLGAITGAAAGVRAMATSVHDETSSISSTWTGLSAGYEAPEQQQVYDLMNPAVTASDELKSAFDSMGGHLDTYASTLEGIKTRLEDFETKAADFRAEVINGVEVIAAEGNDANVGDYAAWAFQWVPGVEQRTTTVPWDQDTATWERNEALLEEYAGLLAEVSAAAAQCANDINALLTNSCVPYVEAIPAEAFTDPENPMPCRARGCCCPSTPRRVRCSTARRSCRRGAVSVTWLGRSCCSPRPSAGWLPGWQRRGTTTTTSPTSCTTGR